MYVEIFREWAYLVEMIRMGWIAILSGLLLISIVAIIIFLGRWLINLSLEIALYLSILQALRKYKHGLN